MSSAQEQGQEELLPQGLLGEQSATVDLLLSMYQEGEEVIMSPETKAEIQVLRSYALNSPDPSPCPLKIVLLFPLALNDSLNRSLELKVTIPLTGPIGLFLEEAPGPILSLVRPTFLSRKTYETLEQGLSGGPQSSIADAIEYLRQTTKKLVETEDVGALFQHESEKLVRAWLYFPSLSTRTKRDDLVHLAPAYNLTGFVLAGKPGVLCLEGSSDDIQAYLADIKRNSWSDIPSFQKKITERAREDEIQRRIFASMTEITSEIERHGQHANRGNLAQVQTFLRNRNLGHMFAEVFGL